MLAIVIPYYKLTFFECTLESLANQTDQRFKVYIGDDAGRETPSVLLEKYKGKFDFSYHRFDDNLGGISLVRQWDRCIAMTGEEQWFMILGDDDTLSNTCIADFYTCLPEIESYNCNVIRYASIINDMVHQKKSALYTHPKLEKATDFFFRRFKNQTRSSLSEYIFKKSAYRKYGFYNYDLAWHSDDRAWLEFSEFDEIFSINSSYMSFRLSGENISRDHYKIKEKQQVTVGFFKFVAVRHFFKFKRHQQKDLLLHYEQLVYLNKKVNFSFWITLFLLYTGSFHFMQSIKFTRRLLIHLYQNAQ